MTAPRSGPVHAEEIRERLGLLRSRLADLTDRSVRVVCVTKAHPVEVAEAAVAAGCDDVGESYAQELVPKVERMGTSREGTGPRWHFVGRLQRNKVRAVAGLVALYQSVDRPSLAGEIARRDPGAAVLVQVDLAGLEGRGGAPPTEVPALVERSRELGLDVRGLMGVGHPDGPEASRPGFRMLAAMVADLGLVECSMGMTGDLDVAVQEGSTMVRVGSGLVGARPR